MLEERAVPIVGGCVHYLIFYHFLPKKLMGEGDCSHFPMMVVGSCFKHKSSAGTKSIKDLLTQLIQKKTCLTEESVKQAIFLFFINFDVFTIFYGDHCF
jgi:acid stress-induced BolA-like protein IbaG/YrbA